MTIATTFRPVITSLLDNDLYKFTMMQAFLHYDAGLTAEYAFKCRNKPEIPLASLVDEINAQIDHLCTLKLTQEELDYLRTLRYIKSDFVDYLEGFQLRRRFINVTAVGDDLEIKVKGPLLQGMQFEIFVLAIVNEVYFRQFDQARALDVGAARLSEKVELLKEFSLKPAKATPYLLFDFGTRRRFSREWHEQIVRTLVREVPQYFRGTSNVDLARRLNITPIGTMAHEYLQAFQGVKETRLGNSQKFAFERWAQEYRGDLGIALTDVVGFDAFLRDFDLLLAKLFDGARHDSGDPFEWAGKLIAHYKQMRINPLSKMLVFSDGLNIPKSLKLYDALADQAQTSYGIGTNATNDVGYEPLQVVMKMVRCNDQPVAKLSDSPGKTMCDDQHFLDYLKDVYRVAQ